MKFEQLALRQESKEEEIFAAIRKKGRDNPRTPMQWENRKFAGFSEVEPWMPVNPNYPTINVLDDLVDSNSILYTYKRLVQLRKEDPLIVHGTFRLLLPDHPILFIYERAHRGRKWLVVANMSEEKLVHPLSRSSEAHQTIIGNYPRSAYRLDSLELEPYETFVVEI